LLHFPLMPQTPISHLHSSILFGFLSLIPNDALRYTLLAITACAALLNVLHFKRPSTQLSQLEASVKNTEVLIQDAKCLCARDILSLAQQEVRLLGLVNSIIIMPIFMLNTYPSRQNQALRVNYPMPHVGSEPTHLEAVSSDLSRYFGLR
jgi:hypothetical protein